MHHPSNRGGKRRSIAIGADHFTAGTSAECPPGLQADGVLDELHRAVGEGDVHAARVVAGRRRRTVWDSRNRPTKGCLTDPPGIIAGRTVGSSGVQIAVDDDVQRVAREPVSPTAPGCVRLSGAGQLLTGLDERQGPMVPVFWPVERKRGHRKRHA